MRKTPPKRQITRRTFVAGAAAGTAALATVRTAAQ